MEELELLIDAETPEAREAERAAAEMQGTLSTFGKRRPWPRAGLVAAQSYPEGQGPRVE